MAEWRVRAARFWRSNSTDDSFGRTRTVAAQTYLSQACQVIPALNQSNNSSPAGLELLRPSPGSLWLLSPEALATRAVRVSSTSCTSDLQNWTRRRSFEIFTTSRSAGCVARSIRPPRSQPGLPRNLLKRTPPTSHGTSLSLLKTEVASWGSVLSLQKTG